MEQKQQQINSISANASKERQKSMAKSLGSNAPQPTKDQKLKTDALHALESSGSTGFTTNIFKFIQTVDENDYQYETLTGTTVYSTTDYKPSNATSGPKIIKSAVSKVSASVSVIQSNGSIQFDQSVPVTNASPLEGHDAYAQGSASLTVDPNDPTTAFLNITTQLSTSESSPVSVSAGPVGGNVGVMPAGTGYVTHIIALKTSQTGGNVQLQSQIQSVTKDFKMLTEVREYGRTWQNFWFDLAPRVPEGDYVVGLEKPSSPQVIANPFSQTK